MTPKIYKFAYVEFLNKKSFNIYIDNDYGTLVFTQVGYGIYLKTRIKVYPYSIEESGYVDRKEAMTWYFFRGEYRED